MVRKDLRDFAIQVQTAFLAGDMDRLRTLFRLPVVVYSMAGVAVMRTEDEFRHVVRAYMAAIDAFAPARSETELLGHSEERFGRVKLVVQNQLYDAGGAPITGSRLRYFVVRSGSSYVVEMIEYLETPLNLPDIEKIYL